VVTLHDVAFLHDPSHFSRHGVRTFRRSLDRIRRDAAVVLCSSQATLDDVSFAGVPSDRLRLVPLGVDVEPASPDDVARVRALFDLPERYLLFVGTVEPRKNLRGLAAAVSLLDEPLPLIIAGADGWGDIDIHDDLRREIDLRFLGFVPSEDLNPLYAGAHVFCYPSEREGYGLPVLEAMAQGVPVVTSRGTATAETAGAAAVLVEPKDPADIARGIVEAAARWAELSAKGLARAHKLSWRATAALTADVYRELAR
jgi:glycosyltransferase involved in cell wall biosynthesis